jgi:hypothetical protein
MTATHPAATGSRWLILLTVAGAVASSGASCPNVLRGYQVGTMPLPRALPPQASLDQVVAAVHDNTQRVRSVMAPQAVLVVPGVPRLSARLACEPPRRFRLQAQTSLTGPELDIGSNDELFWIWLRQHAQSQARRLLPIRADWLPELLGLVKFRGDDVHDGPYPLPDGRLEIRSRLASGGDEVLKTTILDGTTGLVAEQHLFTPAGERLASIRTTRYRVDPPSGAALPRLIEVSWPASGVDFKLELASVTVNGGSPDPVQLWQMPAYPGYEPVDLADPSVVIGPPK